jgi:acetylornithine deacetylase/succinyl-diaminopimelate desuccinylase-like protein
VVPSGDGWTREPFSAELSGGAVFARGAGDDKGDVMARLQAIEAWTAVRGRLPFTLLWMSEGMEEIGSPGLAQVITENLDQLRADACLWESYYRSIDGHAATIGFGSRGVLNVKLSVRLLDADTHSAMAGVYRSSAMILARAVASLVDGEGRVRIPGFYDAITEFTGVDAEVVERTPSPPLAAGAADRSALWADDPASIKRRWLYEPTLNVASFHAGPEGGVSEATVLPASARARLDLRLMPDQDPQLILAALREHLAAEGFPEVELQLRNAIRPARSPLDSPLAMAVRQASTELFDGVEPLLHPVVPGSGPLHLFTDAMPITAVMPPGTIRPESGMHGPDENAMVSHYLDEVKLTLRIFELLSVSTEFGKEAGA